MLRKRSRTGQINDVALDSTEMTPMGSKNASFFRAVPALFVGFTGKKLQSDCDSASSPTSPLEWRSFCNPITNSLSSPKPASHGSPRSWDCDRVGLGIVDSLSGEKNCNPVVKNLNFSENQKVILGSPLETFVLQRSRSFSSDCMQFPLPLTRLAYCNPKSNSDHFCSGEKKSQAVNNLLPSSGKFTGLPSSLPAGISSNYRLVSSLSPREIEMDEDYTCVITRGPNPKTTHIFGDCILESDAVEEENGSQEWLIGSPPPPVSPDHPLDFLSFCCSCKKKLELENDIYMYRGEKAFCSNECRSLEIMVEEKREKSSEYNVNKDYDNIFMEDIVFSS